MISLDTLIDTFNFNKEIKTTESANWITDTVALGTVGLKIFFLQKSSDSSSLSAQINKVQMSIFTELAGRLHP